MRLNRNCPFCGSDETHHIHNYLKALEAGQRNKFGCICQHCGELLVIDTRGLRKPTDDEYGEMGDHPSTKIARTIWLAGRSTAKEKNPILYRIDDMIDGGTMPQAFKDNPALASVLRVMAIYGAIAAMRTTQDAIIRCESYEEFVAAIGIMENELDEEIRGAMGASVEAVEKDMQAHGK
jgi:hypothetical protein